MGGCSVWAGRILDLAVEAAGLRLACPALAAAAVDGPGLRLEFLNLAAQLKFSVRLPLGAASFLGTRSKGIWSRPEQGRRSWYAVSTPPSSAHKFSVQLSIAVACFIGHPATALLLRPKD